MPKFFKTIKQRVTLGRRLGWGGLSLKAELTAVRGRDPGAFSPPEVKAGDPAAILFTSGATGPAKGAVYTHAMFLAQVGLIRRGFGMADGGVDLATFPLFSLFSSALGLTAVIPNMNPVKPGSADPRKIVAAIEEEGATSLFASPALLRVLAGHFQETGQTIPSLARVISAGAPVQPQLLASFSEALSPSAKLLTPYGATEAMPLTSIEAKEVAMVRGMTEQGFGMCVGSPLPGCQIKVIGISEQPLNSFSEKDILPQGEVGELVACGPMVAESYFELPQATALTMLLGPNGKPWRRMGDVGWRDVRGHLWFCGRKSQRVVTANGTLFTIPCESIFLNHPLVRRAALVGLGEPGKMIPVMIIEPREKLSRSRWGALVPELLSLAKANPRTRTITNFLQKHDFPLDIRHNAKIAREKLALWAKKELSLKNMAETDFYKP
jgi:acyl-CoA synthetase (AMP-forming)/AMP-acid ligase II